MSIEGVDYAWGRPGVPALLKAGVKFACRYLSTDTSKNLSPAEARELSAAGIWLVVVWETTAQRALAGKAAGVSDATAAAAQAKACGMPDDRPIYFAVDWDASESQQAAINAYLDGAASVLGVARVGLYGGYWPVKRAFDAKKITYGWQTYAWSGGNWDPRAQLQQYSNDHTINRVGLDYDRAVKDDYGQWRIGASPVKEDDVELTDSVPVGDTYAGDFSHKSYPFSFVAVGSFAEAKRARVATTQILAKLDAQQATIDKLVDALKASQPDLDALKAEIKDAIESVVVHLDVQDD